MSTVIFSLSFLILLALIKYAVRACGQHSFFPETEQLHSKTPPAALFAASEREKHHCQLDVQREKLLIWASLVDFTALENRAILVDEKLLLKSWDEAVEILTERARTDEDVRRLASFCLDNQINVNHTIITAFQKIWTASPDLRTTGEMFRLAAAADDAEILLDVLNEAEYFFQTGKLNAILSSELSDLAENHYWTLSQSARTSGAGFILKEKLVDLRRAGAGRS